MKERKLKYKYKKKKNKSWLGILHPITGVRFYLLLDQCFPKTCPMK